jgi:catechol 2,3-dioxygenase-like lactoylglutathione lyase family enzyme
MYDHIGLRVKDIEVSKRFYRATLEALGLVQDSAGGFGPAGAPGLWLHEEKQSRGGAHLDPDGNNVEAVCQE